MGSQVTLPLWAVILVPLLAALAVIDRILVPSVRWALRRRANRAIDELNTRLKLRIQPFKLTKRQVLIDRWRSIRRCCMRPTNTRRKPACRAKSRWRR